jgi:hypothetical protein
MWCRFWDSFGAHESESQVSDPHPSISPDPTVSFSQLQGFSEITPNESASMVDTSVSEEIPVKGDDMFAFKFSTASGRTHRFASASNNYAVLLETVRQKVISEHLAHSIAEDVPVESWLTISYVDDEKDEVLVTSDADVMDAVALARKMNQDRVKLYVHDTVDQDKITDKSETTAIPVKPTKKQFVNKKKIIEESSIPKEIILPAAIAFLGIVIVGVFAFSRVNSNQR